jgi:hypothetical protein
MSIASVVETLDASGHAHTVLQLGSFAPVPFQGISIAG